MPMKLLTKFTFIFISIICHFAHANNTSIWPNNARAAISLSYDDGLSSQLDNALPALDKYQLKGTFYIVANAQAVRERLSEWRNVAKNGHELGNHTLFHPCDGDKPNRGWVQPHNNLQTKTIKEQVEEVQLANTFLEAIDGERIRTFTTPCFDHFVSKQNYLPFITDMFIGIKTHANAMPKTMAQFNVKSAAVFAPDNHSGEELIAVAKQAASNGTIANFTFHGIGGDHLSVTTQAHNALLKYLSDNKDIYWVDTYRNISLYLTR